MFKIHYTENNALEKSSNKCCSISTNSSSIKLFKYTGKVESLYLKENAFVLLNAVAGGGAGGNSSFGVYPLSGGGGGGGGAAVNSLYQVTVNQTISLYVGKGGDINGDIDGEDSYMIINGKKYTLHGGTGAINILKGIGGEGFINGTDGISGLEQIPSGPVIFGSGGGKSMYSYGQQLHENSNLYSDGSGGNGSDPYENNHTNGKDGAIYLIIY